MIVHILQFGKPLCGFDSRVPRDWPEGHKFVARDDPNAEKDVNCAKCRDLAGMSVRNTNWMPKIESLYAVLSSDEGGEGLCAAPIPGTNAVSIPLIAADETRFKTYVMPMARMMAQHTDKKILVVKFTGRIEIEEIAPKVKPA